MADRPDELSTADGGDALQLYTASVRVTLYAHSQGDARQRLEQVLAHSLEDIEVVGFEDDPQQTDQESHSGPGEAGQER